MNLATLDPSLSSLGLQSVISKPIVPEAQSGTSGDATDPVGASAPQDQTSLSSTSTFLADALSTSDVRSETVARLQQAIAAGTYHVSSSEVAGKLVDSMLERP